MMPNWLLSPKSLNKLRSKRETLFLLLTVEMYVSAVTRMQIFHTKTAFGASSFVVDVAKLREYCENGVGVEIIRRAGFVFERKAVRMPAPKETRPMAHFLMLERHCIKFCNVGHDALTPATYQMITLLRYHSCNLTAETEMLVFAM